MGISQQIGSSSQIKTGVCTSTTRPASPYEGQVIYETDTDKVLVYNGTAWYANWNLPWGYLTHSTLAANTSLTAANPTTIFNISYTHINNRRLRVSLNFSCSLNAATNTACRLQVGGTTVAYLDLPSYNPPSYSVSAYATSTGSSQTFNVALLYGATPSSVSIAASSVAQIIVEDIGPA